MMNKKSHRSDLSDNARAIVDEQSLVWPNSYSEDKPGYLVRGSEWICHDCSYIGTMG